MKRICSEPQNATKSVSFSERVKVKCTTHLNDLTPVEKIRIWYSPSEYTEMKMELLEIAQIITAATEECTKLNKDQVCSRGLERRTRNGSARFRRNVENTRHVVLKEQQRQKVTGVRSPECLRFASSSVTYYCVKKATQIGTFDEQEVMYDKNNESIIKRSNDAFVDKTILDKPKYAAQEKAFSISKPSCSRVIPSSA